MLETLAAIERHELVKISLEFQISRLCWFRLGQLWLNNWLGDRSISLGWIDERKVTIVLNLNSSVILKAKDNLR